MGKQKLFKKLKINYYPSNPWGGAIIEERLICPIALDGYNPKFLKVVMEKYRDSQAFVEAILNRSFDFGAIKRHYLELKKRNIQSDVAYRLAIDKKYPRLNTFAKIFKLGIRNSNTINYFGIPLPIDLNSPDKNFFLKNEIDFEALKQRDKSVKVVLVFGPSTVRESYMEHQEDALVFKIQKKLNNSSNSCIKIMVLNCGFSGFTLYEQFLLYATLFYAVKPEVVITFFGGVDIFQGGVGCELLVKNHAIFSSIFYEQEFKEKCQSIFPLKHQLLKSDFYQNSPNKEDILVALQTRLKQFYDMVVSNKGIFCPIITPLLAYKQHWSEKEKECYRTTLRDFKNIGYDETNQERQMLEKFKAMQRDFVIYDGNEATKNSIETLFMDWIHPNARGNEFIAEYVRKLLKGIL
ncbi:hypothetical protein HCMG_01026 [Helicobacter canadensis MIT 98-5491]|nr:hypothetical protein HCMG_01026 [Helicobacter canadensis MIT 98-5491]